MLQMVAIINRDYLSKIGKETPVLRGVRNLSPRPHSAANAQCRPCRDDRERRYRRGHQAYLHDVRTQYYGTGQYDFGETPLNQLAESLLAKGKNKDAVAIMEMHFAANNPTSIWSYHVLAMSHQANGEIEKAKADYSKVFELHPDDSWAKQQLDALLSSRK